VAQVFPESRIVAFRDLVTVDEHAASRAWELVLSVDGEEFRTDLENVRVSHDEWARFDAAKRRKLARIEPLLRCPASRPGGNGSALEVCGGEFEPVSSTGMACSRCGRHSARNDRHFNLLGDDPIGAIFTTPENQNHSSYNDSGMTDFVEEVTASGGLVLDNGSGFKREYLDGVVNFDIVDYATTDVLGTGETLPFADESFDAVLSFSVLEHVRDPFRCAAEIERVLKHGGLVHVSVPHLAPYHGFPSHYYNMTRQGLEGLFEKGFHIESSDTPAWGQPIRAVTWILQLYAAGLPAATREEFEGLRVDELMDWGFEYSSRAFVDNLDVETRRVLACNNYLVARKVRPGARD
jgi:SAM-dependent methyltransferase